MTAWKSTPPAEPGLYIASDGRRAGFVRYWGGQHWTAPVAVWDVPDKLPQPDWPPAESLGETIYWLEPFELDEDGFIAWSGAAGEAPVRPHVAVEVKQRDGKHCTDKANHLHWSTPGLPSDIVAYRVPEPAPAPCAACGRMPPVRSTSAIGARPSA